MVYLKLSTVAIIAAISMSPGTSVFAQDALIKPIAKSTQAVPIPPVPPAITAVFGPNAALALGTVGIPGVVVGTVVITGVVYSVIVPSSSTGTT